MKHGSAFTPDAGAPLTLGDIRHIAENALGADDQIVEVFTPMTNRLSVTLTVTDQRWQSPNLAAPQQDTTTEGEQQHG